MLNLEERLVEPKPAAGTTRVLQNELEETYKAHTMRLCACGWLGWMGRGAEELALAVAAYHADTFEPVLIRLSGCISNLHKVSICNFLVINDKSDC